MLIVLQRSGFSQATGDGMKNSDKALNVLHSFAGRMAYPGIGTTAHYLVNETERHGCRVMVASSSYDKRPKKAWKTISTLEIRGIRIPFRLLGKERAKRIHDRRVAYFLKKHWKEFDIIHCWPGSAFETLRVARRYKLPSVLHRTNAHTAFAYEVTAREHQKLRIRLPRKYSHTYKKNHLDREEKEYNLADKILVPSEFVAKTFLDRGFSQEKLLLIQYGYDPEKFYPGVIPEIEHEERPLTVVFIGRGEPRKGLHYALKAWVDSGLCNRGRFLIGGDIDFFPDYRKMLDKWLSHPSITVLGYVPEVGEVLRKGDIFVLPSLEEGSAKLTYEARACGCVLVVSDCTGARCKHMEEGLVHRAGDVSMLREHLLMLERDRTLLNRLREKSLSGISNLTWSHAGKILVQQYTRCVADSK